MRSQDIPYTSVLVFGCSSFMERRFGWGRRGGAPGIAGDQQRLCPCPAELAEIKVMRDPGCEIEFTNRGVAEVHHHAVFGVDQLNVVPDKCPADEVASAAQPNAAVLPHQPDVLRVIIVPRPRNWLECAETRRPVLGWNIHVQCLVRTHMIVFLAMCVEPRLPALPGRPGPFAHG